MNTKSRPKGGNGGGKPQRFSVDEVATALRRSLGNISLAAHQLQCERLTIYRYIERFPQQLGNIRAECRHEVADIAEAALLMAVKRGVPWAVSLCMRLYGKHIGVTENLDVTSGGEALGAVAPTVTFHVELVQSRFKGGEAAQQRELDTEILIEKENAYHGR